MGERRREKFLLALASLLHDIGKFVQRVERERESSEESGFRTPTEEEKSKYKYAHAYYSAQFIEKLKDEGVIEQEIADLLIDWGARHHNPKDELQSVISQVADWYSSAHDREKVLQSELNYLHSVFERVSLKPKETRKEEAGWVSEDTPPELKKYFGVYPLSQLKADETIFPYIFKGLFKRKSGEGHPIIEPSEPVDQTWTYRPLFENFLNECKKLKDISFDPERFLNAFYYLLYKYTWCVPSATYDTEHGSRHYPDISLFDHSRVLSAIAVSLYDWVVSKNKRVKEIKPQRVQNSWVLPTDREEVFLLVDGDVGGIQEFIYDIYRSSEAEISIAKALRGRSFFLSMLPEVIARYILSKLDYPITNALFIGGGKFQLLVGNTENNLKQLQEIEEKVNRWLFDEFQGSLTFSMAWVPMKGEALRTREPGEGVKTFLDVVEELQIRLDEKKKRKFKDLLWADFETDPTSAKEICPSCRKMPKEERENLCIWCRKSQEWGSEIPRIRYIAFEIGERKEQRDIAPKKVMDFGPFGRVHLLSDEDLPEVRDLPEILNIEDTELIFDSDKIVNGFKFIGHSAPRVWDEDLISLFNNLLKEKREEISEGGEKIDRGHILPFELLVEFAEGDKKLAFMRADVDYLGLILSDGLRFDEFGEKELYTISRIATLSRMLDLFFSGYINTLAREVSAEYVKKSLKQYENRELSESERKRKELLEAIYSNGKLKIGSLIYTVYSGGDDLFIVAPYDVALEFARKLRADFYRFTCKNPDFGISAGIYIGRHTTPIHLSAKFAGRLEDLAKDSRDEKDSVAIFEKSLPWNREVEKISCQKGVLDCREDRKENNGKDTGALTFEEVSEVADQLIELCRAGKLTRSLLYKFLQLHSEFVERTDNGWHVDPRIYPRLYYYITRNTEEDVRNRLIELILNGEGGSMGIKDLIVNLDVVLYIVLMKTRRGGE